MILFIGLLGLLVLPTSGHAQTYSRCIDANGRIYLTDNAAPPGIHCVAQVTKELADTPLIFNVPDGFSRLSTSAPKTWLLRVGWTKAAPISVFDVPGTAAGLGV